MAQKMAPWVDDPRLEDWSKEDIWDMIMQEFPRMEQSPIFEAGYENWDPYNVENLETHKRFLPAIRKGINIFQKGRTLDASAIDFLNTINIEPHVARENLGSLVGHEIPHLGMRLDTEEEHLFPDIYNPFQWKSIKDRIEKEEKLNMMHDIMYQYTPRGTYGYYAQGHKDDLMNRGYIERIPGGPGYAGGHQYSDKGRELIRTSGLPQEFQRGLGYYEAPNRPQLDQERKSTINWLDSQIKGGQPQRQTSRPQQHHALRAGGIASLRRD